MNVVRQLQKSIQSRGQASTTALVSGLKILLETDLRHNISLIESPLHWLLGGRDSLVPAELAQVLKKKYAQANVTVSIKSAHAPFISHQDAFVKQLLGIAEKLRCS